MELLGFIFWKEQTLSSWPKTKDKARALGYEVIVWHDLTHAPILLRGKSTGEELTRQKWDEIHGYMEGEVDRQLEGDIDAHNSQRLADLR
jgi:hypothetical protein